MGFNSPDTINEEQISKTEFSELAADILNDLVHGDASPFKEAKELMGDYLADQPDLDGLQKASIFADFLKDSYQQINQQAINGAIDILKTNAQLAYEKYKVGSAYSLAQTQDAKLVADEALVGAQELKVIEETSLLGEQIKSQTAQQLEGLAKLKKQYGYGQADLDAKALGTNTNDGALDKQIIGYDKVNYKDTLKAINEMTALLMNASITPGPWMVDIQKYLMEMIVDNQLTIGKSTTIEEGAAVSYTPDAIYMFITETSITNGAIDIAINTPIAIDMSEFLDPATVIGANVTLAGTGAPSTVVTAIGNTIIIDPTTDLTNAVEYTVTVTTDVKSTDDLALSTDYVFTFTTIAA